VSWYEALAYCKWLTMVLRAAGRIRADQEVALPNEPEWEKAARTLSPSPSPVPRKAAGQERGVRAYPWKGDFDPDRANTLEGRVLTTTPVGVYDNASGCGALDISGNVWEWTRSRWGDDPQQPAFGYPYSTDLAERERLDTDDYRVVRGGSWNYVASYARCSCRSKYTPVYRYDSRGFRCVLRSVA
jgi:formylglycine-generating enzyme required for sulfatase activity